MGPRLAFSGYFLLRGAIFTGLGLTFLCSMWQLGLAQLSLPRLGLILCKLNTCKLCHRANLPVSELGHHGSLPAETRRPSPTHAGGWMGWTIHTVRTPTRWMRHSQRLKKSPHARCSSSRRAWDCHHQRPTAPLHSPIQGRNHCNSFMVSAGWQLPTCHGVTNWVYRRDWERALAGTGHST